MIRHTLILMNANKKLNGVEEGLKLAAIDIGTNSIHMVIVRVGEHRIFEIIDREKEMVQLGKGSLMRGRLTQEESIRSFVQRQALFVSPPMEKILCGW
jgi:hypothetical protein